MADFGKQGGKASAPTRSEITGGTPKGGGYQSAPKNVPVNPDKNQGTHNSRRGWK